MSQLRLDALTGRWVVIASERSDRPFQFVARSLPVEGDPDRPCPFCPHAMESLPPGGTAYGPEGHWLVRVVPNLYPAFDGSSPMVVTHLGPVFTQAPASGFHEVLVLSPEHTATWADLPDAHSALVMIAISDRMTEHALIPGLRYSQAVVNSGREAGASVEHPHAQLLSMSFVPGEPADEVAGFARFHGNCLLCTVQQAEEDAGHRVVYADDRVVVVCPFWSGTPYQMLVLPRDHNPHLHRAGPESLAAVGRAIRVCLAAMRSRLGDLPYNVLFHSAPYRVRGDYHWHAHILPKVTTRGGFELGSGVLINVMSPERAADELRSEVKALV
ncbi:MAG: HIT domain-containing protein [Actinomycetota bacterium]|nr:HIT domain-containing protein [Actinomycetota bacterium]